MLGRLSLLLVVSVPAQAQARARAIVDTALVRMGGEVAFRAIHTARYEMVTQWLNTGFDARPFQDGPAYEFHTEWRDYDARIWRNRRRFSTGDAYDSVTDLVVDTVAARQGGPSEPSIPTPVGVVDGWAPLNIAYIDERREAFTFAPEQLLLLLHDARDLRALPDTSIGGIRHSVVSADINGYPTTVLFRQADGFLAMARYHADESNDYGLAPWGPMDVEVWYSQWRYDATAHIEYPEERDIRRVGRPYKRMTVLAVHYNVALPRDSLVLGETVRAAYLAHARKPMADLPIDSVTLVANGRVAGFSTFGAPINAVKIGDGWLLIEPGNLPLSAERAAAWLMAHDPGSRIIGGVVGGATPSGGASWLARRHLPVYTAPAGAIGTKVSLRNYGAPESAMHLVTTGEWVRTGGAHADSVWMEPIDLPNSPRTLLLYVPSLHWVYSARMGGPAERERIATVVRARGWRAAKLASPASPDGAAGSQASP